MFLLDTNVVSELRKVASGRADPAVAEWARATPSSELFVSVVTLHELELGVLLAERADPGRGAVLRRWLTEGVLPAFEDRCADVDLAVVRRSVGFHVPDPAPFRDALIAGTALVHGLTVATRNVRDFRRFDGLDLIDPWSA
ncbi:MAG: type II toxin-antitoxin system VapC family toxin [Sporichthyaceae bacterium]